MRLSEKRKQMVLTGGIEGNIFFDNHIIIGGIKLLQQMLSGILLQPAVNLMAHTRNPRRRLQQPFPVHIFSDTFQK